MFCRELKGLILDDDGLETVEYMVMTNMVMTTLIVVALIVSMVALGSVVESSI